MTETSENNNHPTHHGNPIIEIKGLCTYINDQCIHSNLDLNIEAGEILAIVGGSGSGKTTLMRAILMLQPVFAGEIKVFGKDIHQLEPAEELRMRQHYGVLFQQGALFSSLTVLENVMFPLLEQTHLDKKSIEEIALLKISLSGLAGDALDKYPSELSGGMRKRAALARAIALDPEILFLDEPTAGLDPEGASGLDELVLNLNQQHGLTIIMVTHDLDTLWRVTDRVAFMGEGRILQVDSMDKLYKSKNKMIYDYFNDVRSRAARHIREEIE